MTTFIAIAMYVLGGLVIGAISGILLGYINKASQSFGLVAPALLSALRICAIVHAINHFMGIPLNSTFFTALVIFDCFRSMIFAVNAAKTNPLSAVPHMFTSASVGVIFYAIGFFYTHHFS